MDLILTKYEKNKEISVIYSTFKERKIPPKILDRIKIEYEDFHEEIRLLHYKHIKNENHIDYLFQIYSDWAEDNFENLALTLTFEKIENPHVFNDIIIETIHKLKKVPNIYQAMYMNTSLTNKEVLERFTDLKQLIANVYLSIEEKEEDPILGISEVIIFGAKKSGKSTIIDELLHKNLSSEGLIKLTSQMISEIAKRIDIREFDVEKQDELLDKWKIENFIPHGLIYVIDISMSDVDLIKDAHKFDTWIKNFYDNQSNKGIPKTTPLLIYANKIDLLEKIDEKLIPDIYYPKQYEINYKVIKSSTITGEGLLEGFKWLIKEMKLTNILLK